MLSSFVTVRSLRPNDCTAPPRLQQALPRRITPGTAQPLLSPIFRSYVNPHISFSLPSSSFPPPPTPSLPLLPLHPTPCNPPHRPLLLHLSLCNSPTPSLPLHPAGAPAEDECCAATHRPSASRPPRLQSLIIRSAIMNYDCGSAIHLLQSLITRSAIMK